jgi:DNA invertase Pin-like site-specific DNA recombinase
MKYGYAPVSAEDQNAAMQHTALRQAGCKTIFTDELSVAMTKRPALLRCLKKLERGDTLRSFLKGCGSSTG